MDYKTQLKIQAFLDGELAEDEARETAAWLARDAEATALLTELRHTRQALATFEPAVKLPESREFYWSKIEREIHRLEQVPAARETELPLGWLRRLLVPAGAVAALIVAGILVMHEVHPGGPTEAALADTGALTYRDQSEGMTVVWLSYPAEK